MRKIGNKYERNKKVEIQNDKSKQIQKFKKDNNEEDKKDDTNVEEAQYDAGTNKLF